MKKVIVIDDHLIIRKGLRALISEMDGFEVIAEGGDGKELLEIVSSAKPDIIVLDINMPEMTGIEAMQELNKRNLKFNILIASMHNEYNYIKQCIELGAKGFIFKDEEDQEYITSIQKISNGESYFTPKCKRMIDLAGKQAL